MRERRDGRVQWEMSQVQYRAVQNALIRVAEWIWHDLRFKDLHRSGKQFELTERAMVSPPLAMLTVFPLLVVVAAASAATHHGVAVWVVYGMGLTGSSARCAICCCGARSQLGCCPSGSAYGCWHRPSPGFWVAEELGFVRSRQRTD